MPANVTLSAGALYGFLLVLARVGGALIFVPLPGVKSAPEPARVALALGFTLALYSQWPVVADRRRHGGGTRRVGARRGGGGHRDRRLASPSPWRLSRWRRRCSACRPDMPTPPPSTPTREADSGILLVFAQLMAGMLFFAMGLDREVLRLFAQSLEKIPAGAYVFSRATAEPLIRLGATLFSVGRAPGAAGGRAAGDGGCRAGAAGADQRATATAHPGLPGQDARPR